MKAGVTGNIPLSDFIEGSPFIGENHSFSDVTYVLTEGNEFLVQKKTERTFWQLLDFEISAQEYLR